MASDDCLRLVTCELQTTPERKRTQNSAHGGNIFPGTKKKQRPHCCKSGSHMKHDVKLVKAREKWPHTYAGTVSSGRTERSAAAGVVVLWKSQIPRPLRVCRAGPEAKRNHSRLVAGERKHGRSGAGGAGAGAGAGSVKGLRRPARARTEKAVGLTRRGRAGRPDS
jgi:hypothetical protein